MSSGVKDDVLLTVGEKVYNVSLPPGAVGNTTGEEDGFGTSGDG